MRKGRWIMRWLPFWIVLIAVQAGMTDLVAQNAVPTASRAEQTAHNLQASIADRHARIDSNAQEIRANTTQTAAITRLSARFQARIWPNLDQVESARRHALANCREILDAYAEKRARCIREANRFHDAQRQKIEDDLAGDPLLLGDERITSIAG